jgi:hypothetical protein
MDNTCNKLGYVIRLILSVCKYFVITIYWRLGYGLDDRGSDPGRENYEISSLRHRVQTDSEDHPASYPMGTGDSFLGGKAAGA